MRDNVPEVTPDEYRRYILGIEDEEDDPGIDDDIDRQKEKEAEHEGLAHP